MSSTERGPEARLQAVSDPQDKSIVKVWQNGQASCGLRNKGPSVPHDTTA